jgi:hypothetical protein
MPTKTAAKKTVKKAGVAKKAPKRAAGKQLVYVDNDTSFWVNDGQILNNLVALRDAFSNMHSDVFSYHISLGQNDFANWVEVVLCDSECASDLRKAKTSSAAKTAITKHLKSYTL